jgi:hypothetical protein
MILWPKTSKSSAGQDDLHTAELLVKKVYEKNNYVLDGYGALGWISFLKHDWERGLHLFHYDAELRKQSNRFYEIGKQVLSALKLKSKLSYSLPIPVIAFPRSGSNFLQNVLEKSSGIHNSTIYTNFEAWENVTHTVKSHSLSLDNLKREWKTFLVNRPFPNKAIVLLRDVRDIMISFYEYVQAVHKCNIEQDDFLTKVDYAYAANLRYNASFYHISVADAYNTFMKNWVQSDPDEINVLIIHYEDLLTNPKIEFQKIFNFLELDCTLAQDTLSEKVSLYSNENRKRGALNNWNSCFEYDNLISSTSQLYESNVIQ